MREEKRGQENIFNINLFGTHEYSPDPFASQGTTIPGTMIARGWRGDGTYHNGDGGIHTAVYMGNGVVLEQNVTSKENPGGAYQLRRLSPQEFNQFSEVQSDCRFESASTATSVGGSRFR